MTISFDQLAFKDHAMYENVKHCRLAFKQNHYFSIMGGDNFKVYGDGIENFEVFTSELQDEKKDVVIAEISEINQMLADFCKRHGKPISMNQVPVIHL
jgi:hypothetical protein